MISVIDIYKKPISILKNSTVSDIIKKLLENNISGLAALDGNNSIVGIISKTDILKAIKI